jgi:hypothetical protein
VNGDPENPSGLVNYNLRGDGDIVAISGAQRVQFINLGFFVKSFGIGTSLINVPFNNEGLVTSSEGILKFSGPVQQIEVVNDQNGEIILDGKWSASGGMIQFAQDNALKLIRVKQLSSFSGRGNFLNSRGAPLIDSKARFTNSGHLIFESNAAMEVDRLDQIPELETPEPKLTVEGELKGNTLHVEGGSVEVGPEGKLVFPEITIVPGPNGSVQVIIDGELSPGDNPDSSPGLLLDGGLLGVSGSVLSPLILGNNGVLSPGRSPGKLNTASIQWMPGSRYFGK